MPSSHMRRWPYSPVGRFHIFRQGHAEAIGHIGSGMLNLYPCLVPGLFSGVVKTDEQGAWVLRSISGAVPERIEGLRWIKGEEVLELRPDPLEDRSPYLRPRIDDAECFAAAIALLDYWSEIGETGKRFDDLALLVSLAPFYQCPACEADPLCVDNCILCLGAGFVWEGVALP